MQDIFRFNLELIRAKPSLMWLEERKEEWVSLLAPQLKALIEGKSLIFFCDDERSWFENYCTRKINSQSNERPMLPFFSLNCLYPAAKNMTTFEEFSLLNDMLSIAFPNGFVYFYVGAGETNFAQIAKSSDVSYMWLIDGRAQNAFTLESEDENLDANLINLFKIFDKCISAVLFDEVAL